MQNREWTFQDKSEWGDGPWNAEPDKMQWTDEATGLPCLFVRNHMGGLCGYVGVPEGHRDFQLSYNDCSPYDVHGGLTFAAFCREPAKGEPNHSICHVPGEGEPDRVWWLGFDCGHGGDLLPGMNHQLRRAGMGYGFLGGEIYRDVPYVREQCTELARQIKAAA